MRIFKVEMCGIMNGTSSNIIVTSIHNTLKESIPHMVHACPYYGTVSAINITLDSNKFPSVFPSGTYRSRVHYYDKRDANLLTIISHTTCRSSIKTSF